MPRLSLAALLVLLVAASLIGATGASSSVNESLAASRSAATTLTVNMGQAAVSLDPSVAYDVSSLGLLQNMYVRLVQFATKPGPSGTLQVDPGRVIGYLARSWTVSKDGKHYTFKLRPAKFNDGAPINAAAVKYTLERNLKMNASAGYVVTNGIPKLYTSIKAPSPDTLILNLRQPNPDLLQDLGTAFGSIVEPKVVEANGGVQAGGINKWMTMHIAGGGGPFILQSYKPGVGAVLTRNPNFFGPPSKSAAINVNFVPSPVTLALQARSGQADVTIGMSKQSAASLKSVGSVRVLSYLTDATERVGFVTTTPPFDNRLFREALTYAVPYRDILNKVNQGYGSLMYGPFATSIPGFDKSLEAARPYNLAIAKDLLSQSGVKLPVTAQFAVQNDNAEQQQIATIIQSEWQPLGINVQIVKLSPADMTTALGKHQYPLFIQSNAPAVWSALYDHGYDLKCGSAFNTTNTCIPAADALAKKGLATADPKKVTALVNQMIKLYNDYSPLISLWTDADVTVLSSRVRSLTHNHQVDFRNWG